MSPLSRRGFVLRGLCGCALSMAGPAAIARVLPSSMTPLVSAGYQPSDADERGLWQAFDRLEQDLATSNLLVDDPALTEYVGNITARLLGDVRSDLRIYLVRNPDFNASMAPNGMMLVHTGLLARMRNEAQLAAVLGHESGHYLRRHSLRSWRDLKTKSAIAAVVSIAGAAASGATGNNWYDLANAINNTLLLSLFTFSREMESEADAYGLKLLNDAAYSPGAAAQVWAQLIEERKASAAALNKRYRDASRSIVSTHPPSETRMSDLAESAGELVDRGAVDDSYTDGRDEWLDAVIRIRPMLLEEQIKLNDSGASLYLLGSLAQDGWNGLLRYYEGEAYRLRGGPDDDVRAADAYAASVQYADAPPESHRQYGYDQLKAGRAEEGRRALARYLELSPDAPDAPMVRFTLAQ